MMEDVDAVIELSEGALARIMSGGWGQVYSVSNDLESASLATLAAHKTTPVGYSMADGAIRPSNEAAAHWLEMAAFDPVKSGNTQSYQELMLAITGARDEPIRPPALRIDAAAQAAAAERIAELFDGSRRRVAINLGSSRRWPKKNARRRADPSLCTAAGGARGNRHSACRRPGRGRQGGANPGAVRAGRPRPRGADRGFADAVC